MKRALAVAAMVAGLAAPSLAQKKKGEPSTAQTAPAKVKVKNYDFGGLDVAGRLRTPQLLYFLNRMRSEFDTTTPDKRSFMTELKRSGDEL